VSLATKTQIVFPTFAITELAKLVDLLVLLAVPMINAPL
jgi:hypothetical protein